jgi:hypothetical protein
MTDYSTALADAQTRFDSGFRPKKLLADNSKLAKAEKFGLRNLGLSLAPSDVSGHEVCASRSPQCSEHCIFTSGRGIFHTTMVARILKTLWFFQQRQSFMTQLKKEIRANQDASIRLNVFSDIMWERMFPEVFETFPETQFYDYTKHYKRMFKKRPENYHLTFSLHETNAHQARSVLDAGMNVAAITNEPNGTLFGYPVIDGDDHDLRFLDPNASIAGLRAKGSLKTGSMIYEVESLYAA